MNSHLEVIVRKSESPTDRPPLLFIHGMWHAAWYWDVHFLPYFAQNGYDAYAMSLRGHGESEGRERLRWTSLADYVADVATVVDELEALPVLIGHSMGGMILQKYLETHPAAGVVLLASEPPGGLIPATLRIIRRHPLAFLKANLTLSLYPVVDTPEKCRDLLFSKHLDEARLMTYFERIQDESYRVYLDTLFLNLPRARPMETPMLVLGATEDKAISVKEVHATARAYDVEAEIFPDMGHNMMLEPGWRQVAERILRWLRNEVNDVDRFTS